MKKPKKYIVHVVRVITHNYTYEVEAVNVDSAKIVGMRNHTMGYTAKDSWVNDNDVRVKGVSPYVKWIHEE